MFRITRIGISLNPGKWKWATADSNQVATPCPVFA